MIFAFKVLCAKHIFPTLEMLKKWVDLASVRLFFSCASEEKSVKKIIKFQSSHITQEDRIFNMGRAHAHLIIIFSSIKSPLGKETMAIISA